VTYAEAKRRISERHKGETMPINVTRETKATLTASCGGRVLSWTNDKEPNTVSIAVPGDRAKLTAREARELAAWLNEVAAELAGTATRPAAPRPSAERVYPWR
jgi:hypothetical protein